MHFRHALLLSVRISRQVQLSPLSIHGTLSKDHGRRSHGGGDSTPITRTTTPSSSRPTSLDLRNRHPDEGASPYILNGRVQLTLTTGTSKATLRLRRLRCTSLPSLLRTQSPVSVTTYLPHPSRIAAQRKSQSLNRIQKIMMSHGSRRSRAANVR